MIKFKEDFQEYPQQLWIVAGGIIAFIGCAILVGVITAGKNILVQTTLHSAYFILSALTCLWSVATIRFLQRRILNWSTLRKLLPGIVFCSILTLCISLSTEMKFRVLADEANLVSVSKSMLYDHTVHNQTQGKYYYQNFNPTVSVLGKRPYLYPFLTHILHTLSGYRVENAFILNAFVLFGLLFFTFQLFSKFYGFFSGVIAALSVAAQPIIPACGMSGGFDLLACFLFLVAMMALWKALQNPEDPFYMYFATMQFVLLAHVRYESILFLFITFTMLIFFRRFTIKHLRMNPMSYGLIPIVLSPLVWQRLANPSQFEEVKVVDVFSIQNIFYHSWIFMKSMFNFKFYLPYSGIINIIGCLGIAYLLIRMFNTVYKQKGNSIILFIVAVNLLAAWMLVTSYYSGDPTAPYNARFFLLPCLALSCAASFLFIQVANRFKIHLVHAALIMSLIFLMYYPISIEDRFFNSQNSLKQFVFMDNFVNQYADKNILVISDRPIYTSIRNVGSMGFSQAKKSEKKIIHELSRKLYKDVFVVQSIEYKTGLPKAGHEFLDGSQLEPVTALQVSSSYYLRISKLKTNQTSELHV